MKRNVYQYTAVAVVCLSLVAAMRRAEWEPVFARINDDVFRNGRAYETLAEASRSIGHRLTGTPNGHRAEQYAHDLYANLRSLDKAGAAAILIEDVPDRPEWAAVRDRIARCAAPAP